MFATRMMGLGVVAMVTLAAPVITDGVAAQSGADWFEVPLRVENGRLLVPVEIAPGIETDFIVSTANTVTVLSQAFIDNHGIEGDLYLGDIALNLDGYAVVPHDQLNSGSSTIVGIIGANTLNEFDMLIDAPGRRLVLKEVGRALEFDAVTLGDAVRLRVFHGMLLGTDVDVAGTTIPALLDTGTSGVLLNTPGSVASGVADGDSATLTTGTTSLVSAAVTVSDSPLMERWDPNGAGFVIVGAPIAYDCALAISWVHREMRRCVS